MKEKNTKELNEVLGKTHLSDFEKYCAENKESVSDNSEAFSIYVKNLLQEKKLTQQYVFLQADIPERYGYKLLSGEKRTRQRDVSCGSAMHAKFSLRRRSAHLKNTRCRNYMRRSREMHS